MRDTHDWRPVSSFALLNLCTNWYRDQDEYNSEEGCTTAHVGQDRLHDVLMKVLVDLQAALEKGTLPMTLYPKCNLFVKLQDELKTNASGRIKRLLRRRHMLDQHDNEDSELEESVDDLVGSLFPMSKSKK